MVAKSPQYAWPLAALVAHVASQAPELPDVLFAIMQVSFPSLALPSMCCTCHEQNANPKKGSAVEVAVTCRRDRANAVASVLGGTSNNQIVISTPIKRHANHQISILVLIYGVHSACFSVSPSHLTYPSTQAAVRCRWETWGARCVSRCFVGGCGSGAACGAVEAAKWLQVLLPSYYL